MVTEFKTGMNDAELLAARTQQILKIPQDLEKARQILRNSRIHSKEAYKTKFARRLQKEAYEPGTLVLVRNNPIENSVSIERKTANRYMGPYQVVRRTQGGSYVLEEMNGNLLRHTTAAFRLIPYIQRKELDALVQEQDSETEGTDPETIPSDQELNQSSTDTDHSVSQNSDTEDSSE